MKNLKKSLKLFFLTALLFFAMPQAKPIDPATMTAAAPHAAALAAQWSPHAINALSSAGQGLLQMGVATVNIFRLPLGLLQCTLGAPFGFFAAGTDNCVRGAIAPFELIAQTLLLPVRIISLGTVR